jgi:predicted permease
MNLAVPVAIILFEIDAAKKPVDRANQSAHQVAAKSPVAVGITGLKSPLLWAPILGGVVALTKFNLPAIANSSFSFIVQQQPERPSLPSELYSPDNI